MTALHTAVQAFIYELDLAYQPDGRLAVDANADEACDMPDRSHARVADGRIQPAHYPPFKGRLQYEDVTLTFTSRQAGRLGLDRQVDLV